ncbi:VOC family protein [Vulcaniibacterium tengchongense]|uniref:Putative 3-demethylubiquinone-9 3-methyltransferase (Glyoxalase superfamily) n=1 Tax=Vulcaniibacterium tengchongense TaxID=1273429 RepID=A0A3N4VFY9_9GAMM|nr:VOC family protein [Vulcaniibacterium tengchongense]RPE81942.1 putative 3-demethylubiquinone-9 3-methyltransferase (glyoxalase superfamily) [Vulcaniibacterium tengchongense]
MPLARPITPHLWFDKEAREAAGFYCSVFPDSRIDAVVTVRDTPSGDCDVVNFRLHGQPFMAISAGPAFRFNPSVSFMVNFDPGDPQARARLDAAWAKLLEGGQALMPLDAYPFSPRFGWVQDRYGLSWQLILAEPVADEPRPAIVPMLMFTGAVCGKAEEAGAYYRSVFPDSRPGQLLRHPAGSAPDREGTVMFSDFRLDGTWFAAMDSAYEHGFGFNEAVSFLVHCRDQAEVDRFWERLSAVPEAEQCGWCKDRFGLSWQISPLVLDEVMTSGDEAAIARVTRAFLGMKKFDVAALERAAGR